MYRIELNTGIVRRIADGVQVAPCDSAQDPAFLAYLEWVNAGNSPEAVVVQLFDPQAFQAEAAAAVQSHLDAAAQARGYDNILSAVSYRGDTNPKFGAEAEAFFAWRSAVWAHCYAALAACMQGTRPIPTIPELIAELPALALA